MTTYQRLVRTMALGLILAVITAASGFAQTSFASLRGKVSDEQGGVLPGATVTVRQIETNATKVGVTGEVGQYYLPSLPAGTYEVTVELSGFATGKRTAVVLRVGQAADLDFALKVGAVQENVTVSGQTTLVETQHVVGTFIDSKSIENLPTVSRNFADLAQLAPGVSSTGGSSMGFSAAGQHQFQNNVFVDGATNAMQFYGTQSESFPQDWIQEFQVMTNGFSAEFGNASGAVLNVITRSGTNTLQGRSYGFFQNAKFDTPPYAGRFVNGAPVLLDSTPIFNQRRLGGYLGGPIVTNRMFFFGGVESLDNDATTSLPISEYWRNQGNASIIPTSNVRRPFLMKTDWIPSARNRVSVRYDRTIQKDTNCSGQGGDGCNSSPLWTLEKRATFDGPTLERARQLDEHPEQHGVQRSPRALRREQADHHVQHRGEVRRRADSATSRIAACTPRDYPGAAFGSSVTGGLEGETTSTSPTTSRWSGATTSSSSVDRLRA